MDISETVEVNGHPVLESPPEPASRFFKVAWSLPKHLFCAKFEIQSWFDGLPFRMNVTNMADAFPNIWYHISEKEFMREKNMGILILEPARLLGACKPGSRARMDSRTGPSPSLHSTVYSPPYHLSILLFLTISSYKKIINSFTNLPLSDIHYIW